MKTLIIHNLREVRLVISFLSILGCFVVTNAQDNKINNIIIEHTKDSENPYFLQKQKFRTDFFSKYLRLRECNKPFHIVLEYDEVLDSIYSDKKEDSIRAKKTKKIFKLLDILVDNEDLKRFEVEMLKTVYWDKKLPYLKTVRFDGSPYGNHIISEIFYNKDKTSAFVLHGYSSQKAIFIFKVNKLEVELTKVIPIDF